MILPIKPICKKEWVRRDGTSIIFRQFCRNSEERVLVDTGIAIPPEYWNPKKQPYKSYSSYNIRRDERHRKSSFTKDAKSGRFN